MICTECGQEVKRVCRACQEKRQRAGILLHQGRFLETWLKGEIELRVRPFDGATHIELFDDRWHGYCGLPMMKPTERQRVRELPADLCPACREVFGQLTALAATRI